MRKTKAIIVTFVIFLAFNQKNKIITEPLKNPVKIFSKNGLLEITLKPTEEHIQLAGKTYTAWLYNGSYMPPLLHLIPGDTLKIKLVNGLQMETNLHFHGMNISPSANGDNIFRIANPGDTLLYEMVVPVNHDAGTFWYHPHTCGNSEQQVALGLSGGVLVEGLFSKLPPEFKKQKDYLMLLKDIQSTEDLKKIVLCSAEKGVKEVYKFDSNKPRQITVNGQMNPYISIQQGETQIWRIFNVGADIYYNIHLEGHQLYQIGEDGVYYKRVKVRDSILMPPGSRIELLVQARIAGEFKLKTLALSTGSDGDNYPEATLATMVCNNASVRPLPIPSTINDQLVDYRTKKITARRTFTFTEGKGGFYINDRQFNRDSVDTKVKLGSLEEWTVINASDEMHCFHIHQINMQVIEIDGKQVEFNGYNDVVNMPPKSTIKLLLPFTEDYMLGKFVYHCHILSHEDKGMMQVIEVVR
ncbi:multicopper oxidase family protein [Chitinophagaceae bacterium 26-R-25]|nr:multicopper oxidase family protein [Chitinophagaceae bacterium 26-R-25]